MLESRVRARILQQKLSKYKAKALLVKNKKLILILFLSGLGWLIWHNNRLHSQSQKQSRQPLTASALVKLRAISPNARLSQLTSIAQTNQKKEREEIGKDRHRARYLLGSDLVQQQKGRLALTYLQGLGKDYPILRTQILLQIAQEYQQDKQEKIAQRTLKYLIKTNAYFYNLSWVLKENLKLRSVGLRREFIIFAYLFPFLL